jgi:hypothetical protein
MSSTQLAKLKGGGLSADLMKELREQAKQELERLGSGGGGDVISVSNNKKFSLPNDQEVDEFDGHIIGFAYTNDYYIGPFNPKNPQPPACFAISPSAHNMKPSSNSPMIQSQTDCATCQQNQFGSSPTGNGKACKNGATLAILPPDIKEAEGHDLWVLKISPTAIRHFNKYATEISRMEIPLGAVRTKFYFDPDSTYASVRLEAVTVDADLAKLAGERAEEALQRVTIEPDVSKFEPPAAGR